MRPVHLGVAVLANVAVVGMAFFSIYQAVFQQTPNPALHEPAIVTSRVAAVPYPLDSAVMSGAPLDNLPVLQRDEPQTPVEPPEDQPAAATEDDTALRSPSSVPAPGKRDLSWLAYYVYSEIPPDEKPADLVLESLRDVPAGTPVEEIRRAANAFGINFSFMKAVAKIESDFDPKQRTGSYIGLFQLNHYEFNKYGSGEITNARDNAVAAAYKFLTEATLFEWDTHRKPTFSDLYLIHQQGWQGAAEHVRHPERIAWKSMCATDEGKEKGDRWCKRAIWQNTLPALKRVWKSVEKLPSSAFVDMWRQRVNTLYARYSEAAEQQ
jgi:hypothetical protein